MDASILSAVLRTPYLFRRKTPKKTPSDPCRIMPVSEVGEARNVRELVGDVFTLSQKISGIMSEFRDLEEIPRQMYQFLDLGETSITLGRTIDTLCIRLKSFDELIQSHGIRLNSVVFEIFKKVESTLLEAESSLVSQRESFQSNSSRARLMSALCVCPQYQPWFKVYAASVRLDRAVASVNKDLDDMIKIIEDESKFKIHLQKTADLEGIPTKSPISDELLSRFYKTESLTQ